MKKLLLLSLLSLTSCDITKQAIKDKGEREITETIETITTRKGDTVTFSVPNVIYRDTTIYTVNRQGTTLRTVYNEQGKVTNIDCFSSAINEITKSQKEIIEQWKSKDKSKEENFDSSFILYIVIAVLVLCVLYLMVLRKRE